MEKRVKMKLDLVKQFYEKEIPHRNIQYNDAKSLGKLMYAAYKDTIDYENETEEEFIVEIEKTFEGQYGPFLKDCSFLIEDSHKPIAASIISLFRGVPLIVYTATHLCHVNNGYSTYLIKKSIDALSGKGYKELYLVVTVGNNSAQHVYNKLGFTAVYGEWDEILVHDD